jgi:hypothetical protein
MNQSSKEIEHYIPVYVVMTTYSLVQEIYSTQKPYEALNPLVTEKRYWALSATAYVYTQFADCTG